MVEQLRHAGQIIGENRQELSDAVLRVKVKGKGLIVGKELSPHGLLHPGSHSVPEISINDITHNLAYGEQHQSRRRCQQLPPGISIPPCEHFSGYIPGNQGKEQDTDGAQRRKTHIHDKNLPVRPVIR